MDIDLYVIPEIDTKIFFMVNNKYFGFSGSHEERAANTDLEHSTAMKEELLKLWPVSL
jgi:hypothetical protein